MNQITIMHICEGELNTKYTQQSCVNYIQDKLNHVFTFLGQL